MSVKCAYLPYYLRVSHAGEAGIVVAASVCVSVCLSVCVSVRVSISLCVCVSVGAKTENC